MQLLLACRPVLRSLGRGGEVQALAEQFLEVHQVSPQQEWELLRALKVQQWLRLQLEEEASMPLPQEEVALLRVQGKAHVGWELPRQVLKAPGPPEPRCL